MEEDIKIQMHHEFNRALRVSAATIAFLFICAAIVEWTKSICSASHCFTDYEWIQGLRNFLYIMAMFNILLARYVIMQIYSAAGHIDDRAIIRRLSRADIASMLISGLPCIYGLSLFMIAGDHVDFYLLFGLSMIYVAIFFPRTKKWITILEENLESEPVANDIR